MFVGAQIVNPELLCPRFLGCGFAIEEEDVGVKASPARTALRVALNLLGEKNETGRPKAERAGANESRCRWAGAAKCEDAVLGSRWLDGQARESSGQARVTKTSPEHRRSHDLWVFCFRA